MAKVLLFDAYGTLLNINSLDELLKQYYGDRYAEISDLWRRKQLEYTWLHTLMGTYVPFSTLTFDALNYSCGHLGLSLPTELREKLVFAYHELKAFEEVSVLLPQLQHQGWELAVLSNADPAMLDGAIEANGFTGLFSAVLSADKVQMYKPRPQVYQLACRQFDCDPKAIVFISSNTWDAAGAVQFGYQVAWLNRAGGIMEKLGAQPHWEISDLKELLDLEFHPK